MLKNSKRIISLLFTLVIATGCGEKIPVKEMSLAKMEISRALSVMAKKYAQEEIDEAEKMLLESHDHVKQDALDKAKTAAVTAHEKALEAYNKSIPLLAKDTLDIAGQSLEQAVEAYAEVLAEDEYNQANDSYTKANELYEQEEYYPCYEKALEADTLAKDARNAAIGKKDILSNSIAEVKSTLEEAEAYNAANYAADKVELAEENLGIAEESLESLQLKKGFEAIEIAGVNADEAYLTALQETAREKMENAENTYSEAENSEGAAIAQDELQGAKEALDQSKSLFEESKYKESMLSSEESVRLSMVVLNAMNELAKEKIASAETIYYQAEISEGAAIATDELQGARDALDLSKSLLDEGRAKEAIDQAAESERLSYIVINTKPKEEEPAMIAEKDVDVLDYYIYKVRYIPERRDCLWRIAERYYNEGILWKHIYEANTDKIYDPDLIWPDMLLKVPKLDKSSQKDKKQEPDPEPEQEAITPEQTSGVREESQTIEEAAPAEEQSNSEDAD